MTGCKKIIAVALSLLFLAGCGPASKGGGSGETANGAEQVPPVIGTAFVMDTVLDYKLFGENAQKAAEEIVKALERLEREVSVYLPDSEITRLNEGAGEKAVKLSPDVYTLLEKTVAFSQESGGAFDLTVAPLTMLWDVTAENPRVPASQEISALLPLVDYRDVQLDAKEQSAELLKKGQKVDLGGVAKGFACDVTRKVAEKHGITSGYLSIGGNLMVVGKNPMNGEDFKFGVRDPRGGGNDFLAVVTLPDSTMATSGDYERYFEMDGVRYHHILDPATGRPAQSDLWSVSVVTPDGAYADLMSTYLFIKGKAFALEHLDSYDCGLVLIDNERKVYVSEKLKERFTPSDPTGSYRFEGLS